MWIKGFKCTTKSAQSQLLSKAKGKYKGDY